MIPRTVDAAFAPKSLARNLGSCRMRVLGLLALWITTGCGLGMSGLGPEPPDGAASTWTELDGRSSSSEASDTGADARDVKRDPRDGDPRGPLEAGQSAEGDTAAPDATADESHDPEGGAPAATEAGFTRDGAADCAGSVPAGWTLAIYDIGSEPCPAGFVQHDVYGTPTPMVGACTCACAVSQDGDCTRGTLHLAAGTGPMRASCMTNLGSASIAGPVCTPLANGFVLVGGMVHLQTAALNPVAGSCSGAVTSDATRLSTPPARYCDVAGSSAEPACTGVVPTGFASCIAAAGDVPCPKSTPFVHPFTVGDGAALECSACSACSVATTCKNPTLTAFGDSACTASPTLQIVVDGSCAATGQAGQTRVVAIEYSATASTSCASGSSAAAAHLTNPRTLCCR